MAGLGSDSLDSFARDARATLLRPPDAEVAERHLAAILAEARVAAQSPPPVEPVAGRPLGRIAAALAAALVLVTGGLAAAGVRPPEPISDALESVGVPVPGDDGEGDGEGRPGAAAPDDEPGAGAAEPTPGDGQGRKQGQQPGHPSEEGQETAADARDGGGPPDEPGQSEEHTDAPSGGGSAGSAPATPAQPPTEPQADAPGQTQTDPGDSAASQAADAQPPPEANGQDHRRLSAAGPVAISGGPRRRSRSAASARLIRFQIKTTIAIPAARRTRRSRRRAAAARARSRHNGDQPVLGKAGDDVGDRLRRALIPSRRPDLDAMAGQRHRAGAARRERLIDRRQVVGAAYSTPIAPPTPAGSAVEIASQALST